MAEQSPGNQVENQNLSAIECSLADAHKKLSKLHDVQRASRVQLMVLVGALVLVMLIFGARIYGRVKQNFNHNQVRSQLLERLPILGQDIAKQLEPVLHQVAPVYGQQLKDRVVKIAPDLRDDADRLLKELPNQIHEDIMGILKQSIDRVAMSIQMDAKKTFPYLSDQRAHGMMEHLTDALDRESQQVTQKAEGIFAFELQNVHDIFTRFDVPTVNNKDQYQIEREMIHHLLMYLDSQLMTDAAE
ncbi:MAG: hypothetical protein JKX85_04830 [Phycisphaeraceae bacterium]|nr:hypothetical protein [Phycisphaeraceae bacterium]